MTRTLTCRKCSTPWTATMVRDTAPMPVGSTGKAAIYRRLYCESCHCYTRWAELLDERGRPTGEVIEGPVIVEGPPVDVLLEQYPELLTAEQPA